MTRKPGWNARLTTVINGFRRHPFVYGEADCRILATACVEAITGANPWPAAWADYSTAVEAVAIMKQAGFDNLADMIGSLLPEIHPSEASLGDIAAVPSDTAFVYSLGVVSGSRIFVFGPTYHGLGTIDLLQATRAFRVA